ncbi:FHA domain-containing protein [Streptomyces aidingensis]|uniref:FHA domain-containing protein n=1 Tax=Streptomyces aidingensis TaxID=910347 RepID=A0A1I1PM70_9ACTN|nr:FHA domain-containing protein [Streptomyces aidingensis]
MSFFAKLFGRRQGGTDHAARHRADRSGDTPAGTPGQPAGRPLFRDQVSAPAGGIGPGGDTESTAAMPAVGSVACARCGSRNAASSRFCSNCGNPLRGGTPYDGASSSDTTSTLSISGIEAYEAEMTGQTPGLSPEAQAAVDALPPGSALLIVRRGPNSGSRFLLDGDVTTAGRHPQSDIFLDDVTVSRRHVEFRREPGGGFSVCDVGSLNGTYVNREPIDSVVLANGDEVQIGKYRMVVYLGQR